MKSKAIWLCCLMMAATLTALAQVTPTEPAALNLTLGEQRVRFAATRNFQEMRLEVRNNVGEIVFTHSTADAEFDWNLRGGNGAALAAGLYSYVLTLKFSEEQVQQHRGNLIIEQGQQQVWLTTQDGATVSGSSLNAARSGGRSVAGLPRSEDQASAGGREGEAEKSGNLNNFIKAARQEKAALLGTANLVAKFDVGGVNLIDSAIIETGGNVGIGTLSPNAKLSVSANTVAPPSEVGIVGYFANANANNTFITADSFGIGFHSDFLFRHARGTMAAPTAVQADDIIGQVQARGYGATGFATTSRAGIRMTAAENWTNTAQGAYLSFLTTPRLSNAINVERMRITDEGAVGIGTTAPEAALEVVASVSGTNTATAAHFTRYGTNPGPIVVGRSARGTQAVPAATLDGDHLLQLGGRGHTGTGFVGVSRALIDMAATQDWTGVASGAEMDFYTTPNDSNVRALRMKIGQDGFITVNSLGAAGATDVCRNASTQLSTCSSSLRYKTALAPFRAGLSLVNRLRPISYTWRASGLRDVGLGAEDVAKVEPLLVTYNENGAVEGVKYKQLTVVLINAVKEQQAQIQQLLKTNRRLSHRVARLEHQERKR